MLTEREKMLSGLPYDSRDGELIKLRKKAREICGRYQSQYSQGHLQHVLQLMAAFGSQCYLEPGIQLDYGCHIHIGDRFYANFNCIFLDSAPIRIGNDVLLGPGVQLITSSHPLQPSSRLSGEQSCLPINIGNNVWIGANAVILPGVCIEDNAVVAAGAVVTQDVSAGTLVAGVPAIMKKALIS
ncbi:sugar O-acetyltransferase [Gynuella sunshinyii]|uniref:sugar O-acetyltransferase n=1 Tax=Gynuella sunshinyii TaxID=1445505 RepID=UPI0005CBE0F0|nr:sugar O-acetyltransferase [Gynuella sunshinyii]